MIREFVCESEAQLMELGERLGMLLPCPSFTALYGELGAGKTVITRGIGKAIGADEISSPTFNIVHEYHAHKLLYHFDAYRLENEDELYAIGYSDYLSSPALIVMEWANLVPACLPRERLEVNIHGSGMDRRIVAMEALGSPYDEVLQKL